MEMDESRAKARKEPTEDGVQLEPIFLDKNEIGFCAIENQQSNSATPIASPDLLQKKRLRGDVDNVIKCKTITKFQIENRSSDDTQYDGRGDQISGWKEFR